MNTYKKNEPAFLNKKGEFKKTGRMNEINDEDMIHVMKTLGGSQKKPASKPLVDASSDSIVDPPFLEVYESEFNFYRRESKRI